MDRNPLARCRCKLGVAVLVGFGAGGSVGFLVSLFFNFRLALSADGWAVDMGIPSVVSMPRALLRAFFRSLWKSWSAPDRCIGNAC